MAETPYWYMEFEDGELDAVWRVWFLNEPDNDRGENVVGYGEHEELPMAICLAAMKTTRK